MALIDQAVKLAAEADEPLESNFVRKHSLEQAAKRLDFLWDLHLVPVKHNFHLVL